MTAYFTLLTLSWGSPARLSRTEQRLTLCPNVAVRLPTVAVGRQNKGSSSQKGISAVSKRWHPKAGPGIRQLPAVFPAAYNPAFPNMNPVTHSLHNCIGRPHNTNDSPCQPARSTFYDDTFTMVIDVKEKIWDYATRFDREVLRPLFNRESRGRGAA